jgi:hypothetical protein
MALLTAASLPLPLSGCAKDTGQTDVKTPSMEERIKQIENDKDMPPQAKAIAIQQIQANEARGKAAGESQLAQEKKMK